MEYHSSPPNQPARHRLPLERKSITKRFVIYGLDSNGKPRKFSGTIVVGLYDNGTPGEIFVYYDKEGSRIRAMLDAWCTMVSIALQHGVLLSDIVEKFRAIQFEPTGGTDDPLIPRVVSPLDYICRWLEKRFISED